MNLPIVMNLPTRLTRALILIALAGAPCAVPQTPAQAVVVIANNTLKDQEISAADLHDVFTGSATTLRDGSHVVPVLLKSGRVHDSFLASYIGKSDGAFRAGWRSLLFTGQSSLPRTFDSEAGVVEYVAHTPGALGYVARSTPHEGVKALTVR
jgi:ABC-type phosphate transport system substrate-binding protein